MFITEFKFYTEIRNTIDMSKYKKQLNSEKTVNHKW